MGASAGTTTPAARDEFWYDPDGNRFLRRQSWDAAGTQKSNRTVYLGNYEEVVPEAGHAYTLVLRTQLTATVRYIRTTTAAGAVNGGWDYGYLDHLGSVDAIADSAGSLADKTSFDAFGGLRNKNWSSDIPTADKTVLLDYEATRYSRGFTDHEQLNRTGFIHMNGRVYDPRIGRFVGADPIVQSPTHSQSYNRYSYVFNSPLSYTDPSGLSAGSDRAAALGIEEFATYGKAEDSGHAQSSWAFSGSGSSSTGGAGAADDWSWNGLVTDPEIGENGLENITITTTRPPPAIWFTYHILFGHWFGWTAHMALEFNQPNPVQTLSAGPDFCWSELVCLDSQKNGDTDITLKFQLPKNELLARAIPPDGMSTSDFWEKLKGLDAKYKDDLAYGLGASAYTSNSYAIGLVLAAGGSFAETSFGNFLYFFFPGAGNAVPPEAFGQ